MSRRPTSTATRGVSRAASSASIAMPPPNKIPGRPPSAMSSSGTSNNLKEEGGSRPSSPKRGVVKKLAASSGGARNQEGGEINIQVVVRCRGRSSQELAAASPIITTTSAPLCKSITIETTPIVSSSLAGFTTASSYGGGGPTTKTYPFDKVFGPEADQTMVFNEVAEEMLHEVLAGYNCTIFAYGQTGTGKTYTMQGDLELTNLSAPKTEAGIVPRVLHRLFALLNSADNTEYSVKCSYVELYNEELRDLLSNDYSPATAAEKQPMAAGGTGAGLKLYEDGKKGTMIQGLEEAPVRNLKESLAILNKGCQKRQVAETKMNTESSRSHTIFSITVHVKETSVTGGEDLLRIGKFNLVDLAGSEAIGRSGATDKRAREAGMINQSLLTLGRVISALVEKGSHIPYRESKLTRLLQDSLGGRTKTCIMATVSPTRSNMEETLSTLDYAIRAKSIRNRPEINHHVTKTGLLKEYMGDIDRLKGELLAAREKNGIYIPEEQWREMHEEQAKMKSDHDEAKMKATAIAVELNTRKKEFDEISVKFLATVEELEQAREAERQLGLLIEETKAELEVVRVKLEEEAVVSRAYQNGEERVGAVAEDLKRVANESVADVGGLFEKLARKARVLGANTDAASRFGNDISTISTDLRKGLRQLHHVQGDFGRTLRTEMDAIKRESEEASQRHSAAIDTALAALVANTGELSAGLQQGCRDAHSTSQAISRAKDAVQSSVQDWAAALNDKSAKMVGDVLDHQQEHVSMVGSVLGSTADLVEAVISTTRAHFTSEARAHEAAAQLAQATAQAEISRLQAQNALLGRMLTDEKAKTAKLRTELVHNLTQMIVSFTDEQDRSWSQAVGQVQLENETGVAEMSRFSARAESASVEAHDRRKGMMEEMGTADATVKSQRRAGEEALSHVTHGVRSRLELYGRETSSDATERSARLDELCGQVGTAASDVSRRAESSAKAHSDLLTSLSEVATSSLSSSRLHSAKLAQDIADKTAVIDSTHTSSTATFDAIYAESSKSVKSVLATTSNFIASGILDDVPTGVTPKKKNWNVHQSWERTEPRDVLLDSYRRRRQDGDEDGRDQEAERASSPVETEAQTPPALEIVDVVEVAVADPLATSQMRVKMRAKDGFGFAAGAGKLEKEKREREQRELIPLGEAGGNIPRRARK